MQYEQPSNGQLSLVLVVNFAAGYDDRLICRHMQNHVHIVVSIFIFLILVLVLVNAVKKSEFNLQVHLTFSRLSFCTLHRYKKPRWHDLFRPDTHLLLW